MEDLIPNITPVSSGYFCRFWEVSRRSGVSNQLGNKDEKEDICQSGPNHLLLRYQHLPSVLLVNKWMTYLHASRQRAKGRESLWAAP